MFLISLFSLLVLIMTNIKCKLKSKWDNPQITFQWFPIAPRVESQRSPLIGLHLLLHFQLLLHQTQAFWTLPSVSGLWPSCPILSAGEVSLSSWTQPPRLLIHWSFSWPLLPSVEPEPHPLGLDLLRVRSTKAQGTDGLFVNGGKCPSGCLFLIPLNISCAHWNRQHLISLSVKKCNFICTFFM